MAERIHGRHQGNAFVVEAARIFTPFQMVYPLSALLSQPAACLALMESTIGDQFRLAAFIIAIAFGGRQQLQICRPTNRRLIIVRRLHVINRKTVKGASVLEFQATSSPRTDE